MYVFRLGILYVYLPSHMVSAFTCGAAFHVLTSQVANLLGIRIPRKSGVLSIVYVSMMVVCCCLWQLSTIRPFDTARRSQILRDGFDLQLELITFDIYNRWLLTRRAQAHLAVSTNALINFPFNALKSLNCIIAHFQIERFNLNVHDCSTALYFLQTYIELFTNITLINWATVIISLCNIVFLVIGKVRKKDFALFSFYVNCFIDLLDSWCSG